MKVHISPYFKNVGVLQSSTFLLLFTKLKNIQL